MMRIRERMSSARAEAAENILTAVMVCIVIAALGVVAYAFFDLSNPETSFHSSMPKRNSCPEFDKLVAEENARMDEVLGDAGVNHPRFSEYAQSHAQNMADLYRSKILIC